MKKVSTPEILVPALRQYRHNTGGDDLVIGYDYEETTRIVESLRSESSRSPGCSTADPRAEFEAWVREAYPNHYYGFNRFADGPLEGDYVSGGLRFAWDAWQRARQ